MDFDRLRILVRQQIVLISSSKTHKNIEATCADLGMPRPPQEDVSKREKMLESFDGVANTEIQSLAEKVLELYPPHPQVRNQIQDLLWADGGYPNIPKRFRRELANALPIEELYLDLKAFDKLLRGLWVLEGDFASDILGLDPAGSLYREVKRHVYDNPGDWSTEQLFDELGVYDSSSRRFALFIEGLASSNVRPDETSQRWFVQIANEHLAKCGVELRESGEEGGYPVFRLVSTYDGIAARPKNIIFASSVKPDIRFRDAVSNNIEIVTNADKVLVYDRQIGTDGLRWTELQTWWAETRGITDEKEAKKTLYDRLLACLPENSPPQRTFFKSFFRGFGKAIPHLPCLLPEVWLYWDPKTVKERGPTALTRFRMDFLMLLPNGVRVVCEVDGKRHYATPDGFADPRQYAAMMAGDREMKLAGYEVFRFGVDELGRDDAASIVKTFFQTLFKRYGVSIQRLGR